MWDSQIGFNMPSPDHNSLDERNEADPLSTIASWKSSLIFFPCQVKVRAIKAPHQQEQEELHEQ